MREGSSPPTCHMSCLTCHMSFITYHMSHVTGNISHVLFFCFCFVLQSCEASRWRVCYQRGYHVYFWFVLGFIESSFYINSSNSPDFFNTCMNSSISQDHSADWTGTTATFPDREFVTFAQTSSVVKKKKSYWAKIKMGGKVCMKGI